MLVPTAELGAHAGRVAMVDGGFDPLHPGHVAYFREAAALGVPVLCNVSSDAYVAQKHPPFLTQEERGAIDAVPAHLALVVEARRHELERHAQLQQLRLVSFQLALGGVARPAVIAASRS